MIKPHIEDTRQHNSVTTLHHDKSTKRNLTTSIHHDKTTPRNEIITPHHDKNTSRQDYITGHNEETTKHNGVTTTHNEETTQRNEVTTTHNEETTPNNDKQSHKTVMAFHRDCSMPVVGKESRLSLHTSQVAPSGRRFSRFLYHEATRGISTPPSPLDPETSALITRLPPINVCGYLVFFQMT